MQLLEHSLESVRVFKEANCKLFSFTMQPKIFLSIYLQKIMIFFIGRKKYSYGDSVSFFNEKKTHRISNSLSQCYLHNMMLTQLVLHASYEEVK